jgi:hypothetical protein
MSSIATGSKTTPPGSSLVMSSKFRAFALTFSIFGPVIYCVVQYFNYPLFTYWPAVRRLAWGFGPPSASDGPNMLWYGWTVTTVLIALVFGIIAMILPERISQKLPLWLLWLFPILAIPYIIYSLMPWWIQAAKY